MRVKGRELCVSETMRSDVARWRVSGTLAIAGVFRLRPVLARVGGNDCRNVGGCRNGDYGRDETGRDVETN